MKKKTNVKSIKNLFIKNKKICIILGIILFVLILLFIILGSNNSNNSDNKLKIEYKNDKLIELSKIKKGTVYKNTIVVTNDYDKDIKYSIKWKGVKNTFKEQNKLLYKLDTHDSDALYIGSSQVPIADFSLSNNIVIKSKTKHTYYIYIFFKGDPVKEKKSTFEGILEIKEVD